MHGNCAGVKLRFKGECLIHFQDCPLLITKKKKKKKLSSGNYSVIRKYKIY